MSEIKTEFLFTIDFDFEISFQGDTEIASEQQSDEAAPEHLLIALTEDADAVPIMRACNVDIERLRRNIFASLPVGNHDARLERVHPDASFRTIMRRAVGHIRSVEGDEITGAHVLVQMFADPVARFLQEQGRRRTAPSGAAE